MDAKRSGLVFTLLLAILSVIASGGGSDGTSNDGDTTNGDATDGDTSNGDDSGIIPTATISPSTDLAYLGAFRLPDRAFDAPDAESWEYSGAALAYYPAGDPGGDADGYPGSLFGTGHDVLNHVSEVGIPAPVIADDPTDLNTATTLQDFSDVRAGLFDPLNELPRVALAYLPAQDAQSSDKLYLAWGQHFQEDEAAVPSHAWCEVNLSAPATQGAWWVSDTRLYSVNGYMFSIPANWAEVHTSGRVLATGRFRDGGWSGMGPSLYAIAPWQEGNPPAPNSTLARTGLLQYDSTLDGMSGSQLNGYHHADEWEGGAWLTVGDRAAVVFVGTKGQGFDWYGWQSPNGDGAPCVDVTYDPPMCYTPWPEREQCAPDQMPACDQLGGDTRGWWSSSFSAQMIFYDPADLAAVAAGSMQPDEPQPYATLNIDEHLYLNAPQSEEAGLGAGAQRRYRLGETAYDHERGLLYVLERFADETKTVVHVWRVQ